jgi:hypothetical protein
MVYCVKPLWDQDTDALALELFSPVTEQHRHGSVRKDDHSLVVNHDETVRSRV